MNGKGPIEMRRAYGLVLQGRQGKSAQTCVIVLYACGAVHFLHAWNCGIAWSSLPLSLPPCIIKLTAAVLDVAVRRRTQTCTSSKHLANAVCLLYSPFCTLNTVVAGRSLSMIIKRGASRPCLCLCSFSALLLRFRM